MLKILCTSNILIAILFSLNANAQDYSRKPYASIHFYAEQMLRSAIVEKKEDVDLRQGRLYYYVEKDIPGQYVHVAGGYSGDYYLSLWKMDNGNDLLGVTHDNCEALCTYECSFFECTQDTIKDITPKIFPVKKMEKQLAKMKGKLLSKKPLQDENAQYKFILPHGQGLVQVQISMDRNQIEFPIMELEWTGEKFVIKAKYNEIPEL
ncbi:MAG: hypothetical protein R2780_05035 [Crocinitomicaceae bacterium]|nr:hypothetical protein [Crocinitomicaceae bacterium]